MIYINLVITKINVAPATVSKIIRQELCLLCASGKRSEALTYRRKPAKNPK